MRLVAAISGILVLSALIWVVVSLASTPAGISAPARAETTHTASGISAPQLPQHNPVEPLTSKQEVDSATLGTSGPSILPAPVIGSTQTLPVEQPKLLTPGPAPAVV